MSEYQVAHLDEIEVLDDGRQPYRAVRHRFGITSFGITTWTAREAGDRILNEHDEADTNDGSEELYLVQSGTSSSSSTASGSRRRRERSCSRPRA